MKKSKLESNRSSLPKSLKPNLTIDVPEKTTHMPKLRDHLMTNNENSMESNNDEMTTGLPTQFQLGMNDNQFIKTV